MAVTIRFNENTNSKKKKKKEATNLDALYYLSLLLSAFCDVREGGDSRAKIEAVHALTMREHVNLSLTGIAWLTTIPVQLL